MTFYLHIKDSIGQKKKDKYGVKIENGKVSLLILNT